VTFQAQLAAEPSEVGGSQLDRQRTRELHGDGNLMSWPNVTFSVKHDETLSTEQSSGCPRVQPMDGIVPAFFSAFHRTETAVARALS